MDSEGKFFFSCWLLVATIVVTLIIGVTAHNVNQTDKVAQMVKGGTDPLEAACAIYGNGNQVCAIRAVK